MSDDSNYDSHKFFFEEWSKNSASIWKSITDNWINTLENFPGNVKSNKLNETCVNNVKIIQAFTSVFQDSYSAENYTRNVNDMPELLTKLLLPFWKSFFHLQDEFLSKISRIGESTVAYNFENLDQETFKAFSEIYEKEFKQFFQVPPLGLTREYQEHLNVAADRFNEFQTTVAEFFSLLYLPIEKSMKVMQEEVIKLADSGKLPQNSKEYYRIWVKTLEGHYMALFKSPEYNETLTKTLNSIADFSVARKQMLSDYLQFLPIPNYQEMDELYKEIYLLKKRVRELEKRDKTKISLVTDDPN